MAVALRLSPLSQSDGRVVAGMVHEGRGLDHEIHVDVAAFQRRNEEIWCSMSGSLNVLDDVHYTGITYIVQLHAGERVTVYDRNLHQAFPAGAQDIQTVAWNE